MRQDIPQWRLRLRQRRYHRAFRIAEPRWDKAVSRYRELFDGYNAERAEQAPETAESPEGGRQLAESDAELARMATNLWLTRKKFLRSTDPNSRDHRQANRHLQDLEKSLNELGVTIKDHDGSRYDPGFVLEVRAFEHDPELSEDIVLETLRPSVYCGSRCIQVGQVIVGRPVDPERTGTMEDEDAGHH